MDFAGKRVLVTGAGQGIGHEIAKALFRHGAKVVALSKSAENLATLAGECPGISTVMVNLQDWEQTRSAVEGVGPVDMLVNNAGTTSLEPFLDVKEENFNRVFDINVKAVINVSQVIAKLMIEKGIKGSIVNLGSVASMVGFKDHTVYCASKGALDAVTKVMALELGAHKIRVNCVSPTVVLTEMGKLAWSDPAKSGPVLSRIPLGRFAEVQDVVDATLFLLSDKAAMINGVSLPIDGGFLAC